MSYQLLNGSKEQRFIERIRCIAYREVRDEFVKFGIEPFIDRNCSSRRAL